MRAALLLALLLPAALAVDVVEVTLSEAASACPGDLVTVDATLRNLIDDSVVLSVAANGRASLFLAERAFPLHLGAFRQSRRSLAFRVPPSTPPGEHAFSVKASLEGGGQAGAAEGNITVKDCGAAAASAAEEGGSGAHVAAVVVAAIFLAAAILLVARSSRARADVIAPSVPGSGYAQAPAEYYGYAQERPYAADYQPPYGPEAARCYYYDRVNFGPYYAARPREGS